MNFSCNRDVMVKALNTVTKAVSQRTTIPILKGILLKATDKGILFLTASDLDISIEKCIEVNVEEAGSVVVDAKLFSEIIRKLPNEEISFSVNDRGFVLIKTLNSEFNIVAQEVDRFPSIGEIEEINAQLSFNKDILREMIRKTYFCASIEESKGIITGVLMEMDKNSLNMVALDGYRMAVVKERMTNEESRSIIIPAKILGEVYKIFGESDNEQEDVKLILSDKKGVMLLEKTKIVLRIFEGEFIKYKDILPKENSIRVVAKKGELSEAIERAALFSKEGKNNLIRIKVEENLLTLSSNSEEGDVKEEMIVQKTGENIEIGFNSKYIIDSLRAIDDEEIVMEFESNIKPCLIKPVEGNSYEYLILPVRISN